MSVGPSNHSNGELPGLTTGIGLALESLVHLPSSRGLKECLSTFRPYDATNRPDPCPDPISADKTTSYPLAQALIKAVLELLGGPYTRTNQQFNLPKAQTTGQTNAGSLGESTPSAEPAWPGDGSDRANLHRQAQILSALTLSASIAGSSNLILADRSTRPATRHQPRAQAESRPSRRRVLDRQSWLRDVSKKHAFAISSAAINSLFLVMPYAQNCWAALPTIISNTTYQTSAVGVSVSAVFEGGTLQVDQATIYTSNFTLNNSNGNTIDTNGFNATFSGVFSNEGVNSGVINFIDGSGGGTITLTGNNTYTGSTTIASNATLTLTGDGSIASSSDVVVAGTFDLSGSNSGATIVALTGAGGITLGDKTLTVSAATGTYSGVMSGTGGFTLTGGFLTLTGNNTYTGTTTISGGTLKIGAGGGSGAISNLSNIINNANLSFFRSSINTYSGVISGSGNLTIGAGRLILAGNNTYTGSTTINAASTLQIGTSNSTTSAISDSSNITFNEAALGQEGNLYFLRNSDYTYGGKISGAGDMNVSMAGNKTLTLTGSNTNSGNITINTGTLQIGAGGTTGSLGSSSSIINYANLVFNRSDNYTHGGTIRGNGTLTQRGAGTLIITAGNSRYNGTVTISAGTLQLGAGGSNGFIGDAQNNYNPNIINNANLTVNRNNTSTVTYKGVISGSGILTKLGTGTLILTGNNTYTGTTTISGGGLMIGAGGTTGALSNSSNITNNANLTFNRSNAYTYGGVISGSGNLTQFGLGTFTLTGNNTYTGATTIGAGRTLALTGDGSIATSSGVAATGTFDVSGTTSGSNLTTLTGSGTTTLGNQTLTLTAATGTNSGTITGNGALTINGSGTYRLSGVNSYAGSTTVGGTANLRVEGSIASSSALVINSGATLSGNGAITGTTINAGGILAPNNAGSSALAITGSSGDLTLASGSISNFSITTANSDRVSASGTISLDGVLNLAFSGGNYLTSYTLFSGQSLSGSYTPSNTYVTGLSSDYQYNLTYTSSALNLSIGSVIATTTNSTNPFSTTFAGGTLHVDASTTYSTDYNTGTGGTVDGNSYTSTLGGVFSGSGALTFINTGGLGSITLTGNNTYTGGTTILGTSSLSLSGAGSIAASNAIVNNGTLSIAATNSGSNLTTLTGSGTTTLGNQTLTLTAATGTNSGTITGNGALTINGSGTYSLSGVNSYAGSTTVGGTANLRVEGSIASSSALVINSGATLSGNGAITVTTINAGGILAPNNAGSSALAITGSSGDLTLASGSISNFSITTANSDRVSASGTISLDGVLNLAFSGGNYLTSYTLFSGQNLSGSYTPSNIFVTGLSSDYQYNLSYTSSALNLVLGSAGISLTTNASNPSSTTFAGGTLVVDAPGTHNTAYGTGTGGSINQNGNIATFSGVFSGTGALTFTNTGSGGNIIFSGNNTYTGASTVNTGATLSVNGSIASSSGLTVNAGGTIGGNGSLPGTTINAGGTLAPGNSIGQLTAPSLNFGPGGILDVEIQGPQNDKTTVTGNVTNFSGTANLTAYGGGTPWPGFDYQLITAANNFATSTSLTLNPVGITSALLLNGTTLVQEADGNGQTFDVMWRPNNGSGATASAMQALGQGNTNQLASAGVFDSVFQGLAVAAGDASGATTGLNATGTAIGSTGFTTGQAAAAGISPDFLTLTAQLLGITSSSQLTAAISTLGPESYAAFQSVGLETLQRQRQQLLVSAGQCANHGWVINAPTSKNGKAPKNPICLYGQAAKTNSSITGQNGLASYNSSLFSSFYGLEIKANPYWTLGAAYGYGTSNLNGLGPTNAWVVSTVNSASLYGVYTPTTSSPWTFKGLLGYGNYALNGSRQVAVIGAGTPINGSTTANGLTAALTAQVIIPLTKPSAPVPVLLKPLLGLAYGNFQQAGFSESGGGPLNLNVDGNSASSLVGTIGLELTSGPIPLNKTKTISLVPKLALAYHVDALAGDKGNSSLLATLPASGAESFLTQGQNRGFHSFSISAGADLALSKSTVLFANVNLEAFSSGNQFGYGGGIRVNF